MLATEVSREYSKGSFLGRFEELASLFNENISHLVSIASEKTFLATSVIFLTVIFVWWTFRFTWTLWLCRRELIKLKKSISAKVPQFESGAELKDLGSRQHGYKIICFTWLEYFKNLEFCTTERSPDENLNTQSLKVYSSLPAGEFFYLENVLHRRLDLRLLASVPGKLTGLGVLGTFLGLAGGVGSAVGALGGSSNKDIQVTIDAMQSLLQSASLAFITSIFGILYSMLFSIIEKFFIRRCEREIAELVDLLEEKFPKIPSDSQINLMLAQLKVIQGHQKEQVGQGSKEVETLENLLLQLKKVSFIRVETNGNKES